MTDFFGLAQRYPAYVESAGKWIYDLCAARHVEIKAGIVALSCILYLCAALRERRFFGAAAWIIWAAGCAFLGRIYLRENSLVAGELLYGAAAALMLVYCAMARGEYGLSRAVIGRGAAFALMVFIVLCACFMRFYQLGDYPYGIADEESAILRSGASVLRGEGLKGWGGADAPLDYVRLYGIALFFKLFGVSLLAGRAAMAFSGVLEVIAIFLMTGLLFNRTVALFAASFLAVCHCSAGLERTADAVNQGALFACLAAYLLLSAERKGSMFCGVIGGAAVGLLLGAGGPFGAVALAFLVFIAYRIIFERGYLRKNWLVLVLAIAGCLAAAGFRLQQGAYALQRLEGAYGFFKQADLPRAVIAQGKALLPLGGAFLRTLFIGAGAPSASAPAADDFLAPLFFIGLVGALYCWRRWNYFLVLAWLIIASAWGLSNGAETRRIMGFLPAVRVIAALGAFLFLRAAAGSLGLRDRPFFIRAVGVLTAALLSVDAYVYFGKAAARAPDGRRETAEYVDGRIGKSYVYLVEMECDDAVYAVTYKKRGGADPQKYYSFINADEVYDGIFNSPPRDQDVAFVFGKSEMNDKLAAGIVKAMPYAKVEEKGSMLVCSIPESGLAKERGADVSYRSAIGNAAPAQWGLARTASTEFDWEDYPVPYPFSIEVEGVFYAPKDDAYGFRPSGGGDTKLAIDGKTVPLVSARCFLESGAHRIRLRHVQSAPGKFSLVWKRRGAPAIPVYLWGAALKNLYGIVETPTPKPTPTSTPTPTPTITPTPSGIWRMFYRE